MDGDKLVGARFWSGTPGASSLPVPSGTIPAATSITQLTGLTASFAGLAQSGDRLTRLSYSFYKSSATADVDLTLAPAQDYRGTEYVVEGEIPMIRRQLPPELEIYRAVGEREAMAILGVSLQTGRNWRSLRRGPPYLKLGRAVRYPLAELLAWRNVHRIIPGGE